VSNSSFHLFQLQKVDHRLDQIEQRSEKIAALLSNNPKLRSAEAQVKAGQQTLQQKEDELKTLEGQANGKKIKIEQSEAALYSGKNSNPKELKDLQLEIEALKRALGSLDEEQLNAMAILDEINQKLQENQAAYTAALAESQQENQQLFAEKGDLDKEKEKLLKERQAAAGQIAADAMSIYEKLRGTKNHIAVTAIDEQCCSVCGSEITASDIQKARASSGLSFCPSCGRILYAG